jgi:hypothetical protein
VSEKRALRKICGSKKDEVTEDWTCRSDKLQHLYSSTNTIPVIKSRGMRWAGNVARKVRVACGVVMRKPEGRRPLRRARRRRKEIIKSDFKQKSVGTLCSGLVWLRKQQERGCSEDSNRLTDVMKSLTS